MSLRLGVAAYLAMISVYFFSYFQRAAVPGTIFNELQVDMNLGAAAVASLGAMFTLLYGGMQIFVGIAADRFGGARTLLGGGLIMAAGALLFPLSHSTAAMFAARALTGLGASFVYLSIIQELGFLFAARHFTVLVGVMLFVGYCGGMVASLPFERAATAFGWRACLLAVAVLMFAVMAVAALILRRRAREPRREQPLSLRPLGAVMKNRACWPLLGTSFISFPIFFVIQTVLGKKFLQDFGGLSSPASATFVLVMTAVSAISVVLGGLLPRYLSDRRKPWLIGGALLLVLATALLMVSVLTRAPGWAYLAGFVLLATACGSQPSGISTMKELNRPESVGAAISVTNSLVYIGGAAVAQAGGFILDQYRDLAAISAQGIIYPQAAYVSLFGFLAGLALLNLVFSCFIPETRGRSRYGSAALERGSLRAGA